MQPNVRDRRPLLGVRCIDGLGGILITPNCVRFRPEADIGLSLNIQILIRFEMNWTDVDHESTGGLFLLGPY